MLNKLFSSASDDDLKRQNNELRATFAAIERSQAVIEFEVDGTIIRANENFLNAMGYAEHEVIGQHHSMFASASYRKSSEYQAFWQRLRNGEFFADEFQRFGKNEKEIWIQATYNPIKDEAGQVYKVIKFATDITDQKIKAVDSQGQIEAISKSQAVIEFHPDGTIITANDNFLSAMGYSLSEIQGQHHEIFVEEGYRNSQEYREFWLKLKQGEYESGEFKRFAKDGSEVWINASYNPIFDLNGKPFKVVKYASDITQQKLQTANYEGQINAISKSQAVIEFDMGGNILHANENFLATTGYRLEEIKGKHHAIFMPPEDRNSAEYRNFWESLNRGEFSQGEFRRVSKSGEDVWIQATYNPIFDMNGKPFKVVKFASNITDEVQKRDEFVKLSLVSNETDNSVIITDSSGHIEYVNPGFTKLTGYTFDEVEGKRPGDVLQGEETDSEARRQIREKLDAKQPFYEEILNYDKSGNSYWISLAVNPVFDSNGEIERFVSIQTNISETKKSSLEFSSKLDAISRANAVAEFDLDGRIEVVNSNYMSIFDANQESQLLGLSIKDVLAKEFVNGQEFQNLWHRLKNGEHVSDEFKHVSLNGDERWINGSFNPIFNASGSVEKIVLFGEDATARKLAVNLISESLVSMSEGDLGKTIDNRLEGEFGLLGDALNSTLDRLNTLVGNIVESANFVSTSSREIQSGNSDLSARTEQQASSLEETASSMEQLTATVNKNAENARDANNLSLTATETAEKGGEVVGQTVKAMEDINNASKKISDIISVIDDIAFQTNLLALNAAVEAARAGEQGRGFAVVAGEVRNLAQRSAEAAKEIKALIVDSVDKVSEGTRLVDQSGKTLEQIIDSVRSVSTLVSEIDGASQEQARGIGQVNTAVTQMDGMTQQNAAMVEEASAASNSMSHEAGKLLQLVQFFKQA